MAKTKMNVISIFDGKQDATDVFVALIADKMRESSRDLIAGREYVCYDKDTVQRPANARLDCVG